MMFRLITTFDDLCALQAEWNELSGDSPFRSWDWLATWWKHYGAVKRRRRDERADYQSQRQLHVVAVYDAVRQESSPFGRGQGEDVLTLRKAPSPQPSPRGRGSDTRLIGVAPWYIDRTIVKGNVLRWLGSGEVCTDHLSLICRPEHREQVAAVVAEALTNQCDEWDRLDLNAVDADDYAMMALVAHLEERDCIVSRQTADSCWVLDLPVTWDDYLAGVSKSHRKQLRQSERRVIETSRVVWHTVSNEAEFETAWLLLVDLHQRRRTSLGEAGCFVSRAFHEFHHEVAQRMLERGQLRMSWLSLDGTPAAAEYHFADNKATYAYQGGVDPDRLNDEPGRLSTILCLRRAIDEGHKRFDFLRGDEPYKAHWRAEPRTTYDYRAVPNRRLARLRGHVLTFTGAVTDWMRTSVQQGR
jgi:hypothetical protein